MKENKTSYNFSTTRSIWPSFSLRQCLYHSRRFRIILVKSGCLVLLTNLIIFFLTSQGCPFFFSECNLPMFLNILHNNFCWRSVLKMFRLSFLLVIVKLFHGFRLYVQLLANLNDPSAVSQTSHNTTVLWNFLTSLIIRLIGDFLWKCPGTMI